MDKTIQVVENVTGLTFDEINNLDSKSERQLIKEKNIHFSKKIDSRIFGRGNPLLARRRFTTIEDLDNRLEEIVKNAGQQKKK